MNCLSCEENCLTHDWAKEGNLAYLFLPCRSQCNFTVKKKQFWLTSLVQGKSDAKPENKVCSLYSKLQLSAVSHRTELLTDFIWSRWLMEVKRSAKAGCFVSFYRNTARVSFSATCIGWRVQGLSKCMDFLAGLLAFLIPLIYSFITIMKSGRADNQSYCTFHCLWHFTSISMVAIFLFKCRKCSGKLLW